jgi:hypothetical protein
MVCMFFSTLQSCSIIVVTQANGTNCLKQVTFTMVTQSGTEIGSEDQATHYRNHQEKGWQVINAAFLALPVNEWYLLPSSPTSAQDSRSASKVFGNSISTLEYLALIVACGFFAVRKQSLICEPKELRQMKGKYTNLSIHVEIYHPRGAIGAYYICHKSQLGCKPKLNRAYIEGQGFSATSGARKSINKTLVDDVIEDIALPSFSFQHR